MQRLIITTIFFLLITINLYGQWEVLNEGIRGAVNSVDFVDNDNGWMVGSGGLILKTEDGGLTWETIPTSEEWYIIKIDFINQSDGWMICRAYNLESDLVLRTENGGFDWIIMNQQAEDRYDALHVLNNNIVFVGTNTMIKKTVDGGKNWIDISPENADGFFHSVRFYSDQIGLVAGMMNDNGFYRGSISITINGGSTWENEIFTEFNTIHNLQFSEGTVAYFIAENWDEYPEFYLCRTRDFAQNREIIFQSNYQINSYFLSNNDIIYISVSDSLNNVNLMKSLDGGGTWESIFSLPNWQTAFINLDEENSGVIIAQLSGPEGGGSTEQLILSDRYDEKNWLTKRFSYNLTDVCFINPDCGLTVGGFSIFHGPTGGDIFSSIDGGLTWSPGTSLPGWISSLEFANDSIGYVITENWSFLIFKTSDCGRKWNIVYENNYDSTGFEFFGRDIFLKGNNKVWIAGTFWEEESSGAAIFNTSDGGVTWKFFWTYLNTEESWYNLQSIHIENDAIWAVGDQGFIVRIVDKDSFQIINYPTDLPLNEVFFNDSNHGWIAGGYGYWEDFQPILLKTSNGGATWNEQENFPYMVNDLFFRDSLQGWAVGSDQNRQGIILATSDGGNSWTRQAEQIPSVLTAIDFIGNYGWAVGESGLILKTDNGGASWIDNSNKKVYAATLRLEQNYPNPFNPKTIINYELPTTNEVELSIYNLLGQKVTTLVSKKQPAGKYRVEWDASRFASGVYIYRLSAKSRAQSVVQTRKLVLLK